MELNNSEGYSALSRQADANVDPPAALQYAECSTLGMWLSLNSTIRSVLNIWANPIDRVAWGMHVPHLEHRMRTVHIMTILTAYRVLLLSAP
jgi:hypothetical protein